jgi:hypothetical protein
VGEIKLSKINFLNIQSLNKRKHRVYIVQVNSKHTVDTIALDIPYGTNSEEWLSIKEVMETKFKSWLDKEPHVYTRCGINFIPDFELDFSGKEIETKDVDHELEVTEGDRLEYLITSVVEGKKGSCKLQRVYEYQIVSILKEFYGYEYDTHDDMETNEEDIWYYWDIGGKRYCFEMCYEVPGSKFYLCNEDGDYDEDDDEVIGKVGEHEGYLG